MKVIATFTNHADIDELMGCLSILELATLSTSYLKGAKIHTATFHTEATLAAVASRLQSSSRFLSSVTFER